MAANQTIIKAAGQRYSSVPTDYSGYLQGLTSITGAVVQKTKENKKNQSSIDKLMVGFNSKIKPYDLLVKDKIGNAKTVEEATALSKSFNEQKVRYETYMTTIHNMLNKGKNLTNSIDPLTEMWMRSLGAGDFDNEYSIKTPAVGEEGLEGYTPEKTHTFNMDFRLNENLEAEVIGPNGEYINMDELEDLLIIPNDTDGQAVTLLINKFATLPENQSTSRGIKSNEDNYLKEKTLVKTEILALFKGGSGGISGENVRTAFMFDEINFYVDDGEDKKTSFLQYYLSDSKGRLFPTEFKAQYDEYAKELNNDEISEKRLAIIAQDLIKNDPNINADLDEYIDYLLEFNK